MFEQIENRLKGMDYKSVNLENIESNVTQMNVEKSFFNWDKTNGVE